MKKQDKKRGAWVIRVRAETVSSDHNPQQEEQEEEGLTAQADMQNATGPDAEIK